MINRGNIYVFVWGPYIKFPWIFVGIGLVTNIYTFGGGGNRDTAVRWHLETGKQ